MRDIIDNINLVQCGLMDAARKTGSERYRKFNRELIRLRNRIYRELVKFDEGQTKRGKS